ncbi:unnamed protein product [Prorocentrum cordatum]|uniref:Uncharacterized protein n=1 Tax=Prorocentrum cordatum TaxID=2364126 RepID=A0ABN9VLT6_9DINO|nr:unnamed protein product [Polarella glacialis]
MLFRLDKWDGFRGPAEDSEGPLPTACPGPPEGLPRVELLAAARRVDEERAAAQLAVGRRLVPWDPSTTCSGPGIGCLDCTASPGMTLDYSRGARSWRGASTSSLARCARRWTRPRSGPRCPVERGSSPSTRRAAATRYSRCWRRGPRTPPATPGLRAHQRAPDVPLGCPGAGRLRPARRHRGAPVARGPVPGLRRLLGARGLERERQRARGPARHGAPGGHLRQLAPGFSRPRSFCASRRST